MLSLASPWLLVLLPLPLLAARILPPVQGRGSALVVPGTISRRFAGGRKRGAAIGRWILPGLLWLALVTALAGPRIVMTSAAAPTSGREIVLALDLSGSMVTPDFTLDGEVAPRVDVVKRVASSFVRGRKGDRLALVLFGSEAYFATPQTYDVEAVASAIEEAAIGISGRATGISDALGLALKRLEQADAMSKVVILLSDGVNNSGAVRPRGAAQLAAELGIRVHTIALGPEDLAESGSAQRGGVDTETLRAIARISGGEAFRVRTTEDLERVAAEIDRLETNERDGPTAELYRDLWLWPGSLAFLLAAAMTVLGGRASRW